MRGHRNRARAAGNPAACGLWRRAFGENGVQRWVFYIPAAFMVVFLAVPASLTLVWSFFERIGQQGIQFVISIILDRLLLPEEFGLIAMLTVFMAVAQSFIDSGFGQALIQKQTELTALKEFCSPKNPSMLCPY